jgi:hypothetical protein
LDVVIVRHSRGRFPGRLPDGLDNLAAHNLLTFKSFQQPLDDWALHELIGHYVAYRKMVGPSADAPLPAADVRLYAVCVRYPHNLAQEVPLQEVRPGIYDCRWGTATIRVIVVRQLPQEPRNAPLHLFASDTEQIRYGRSHYCRRSERTSTVLSQLFEQYQGEGVAMPYTMEDFLNDYVASHLKTIPPEQRFKALQGLPREELFDALRSHPPQELRESLTPEQIAQLESWLQQLRQPSPQSSKSPRRGRRRRTDS